MDPINQRVDELHAAELIDGLLGVLALRQRLVLELRQGLRGHEPLTLEQIGRLFGVTRERVRQIEKRALDVLRDLAVRARAAVAPPPLMYFRGREASREL